MKKTLILFLCIYLFFLTGCDHIGEIENNRVITACFIEKTENKLTYGFYVSLPSGGEGGEDSGSKSSAKTYVFDAKNFDEAINLFEKSGVDKTDLSHISLIVGNEQYFDDYFKEDEKYIRKNITATPLVYSCIYNGKQNDLIECINKEYSSKAEDFAKNIFSGKNAELSCMLSEIVLSVNNNFYTSVIPVIEIEQKGKNKLPEIINSGFYTADMGVNLIDKKDYNVYVKWQKKYNPSVKGYRIDVLENNFVVSLNDDNILNVVAFLAKDDIDILNIKYYGKKCFVSNDKYKTFIRNYKLSKTVFKSD